MKRILFLGDSLTAGYGLTSPYIQSFPALIQHKINVEAMPYRVVNAGHQVIPVGVGLRDCRVY